MWQLWQLMVTLLDLCCVSLSAWEVSPLPLLFQPPHPLVGAHVTHKRLSNLSFVCGCLIESSGNSPSLPPQGQWNSCCQFNDIHGCVLPPRPSLVYSCSVFLPTLSKRNLTKIMCLPVLGIRPWKTHGSACGGGSAAHCDGCQSNGSWPEGNFKLFLAKAIALILDLSNQWDPLPWWIPSLQARGVGELGEYRSRVVQRWLSKI